MFLIMINVSGNQGKVMEIPDQAKVSESLEIL